MQQQVTPQFTFEGGHLVMFHQEETGLPQVKDSNVNDRDRMQDLLSSEKYMTAGYTIGMNEASHDALFQVLKQNHDKCQQNQRQLFDTMFKKGWYKLPVADAQSVTHAYNQFKQYQGQFPFPSQLQQQQNGTHVTIRSGGQQAQGWQQQQAQGWQQPQAQAGPQNWNAVTAQVSVRGAQNAQAGQTAGQTANRAEQELSRKVDQALREAERGQIPKTNGPVQGQYSRTNH